MSTHGSVHSICQLRVYMEKDKRFIIGGSATLIPGICSIYETRSYAGNKMKQKRSMYALLLPVMFFLISYPAAAQDSTEMKYEDNARVDSVANANQQQETANEARENSENLSDLKAEKKETKAKAREAQRIEDEANDAAMESRMAYRKEKKAQKAREQADKQTKKAAKARTISDRN